MTATLFGQALRRADKVAEAVWFLASPAAFFVTGAELGVDGGLLSTIGVDLGDEPSSTPSQPSLAEETRGS